MLLQTILFYFFWHSISDASQFGSFPEHSAKLERLKKIAAIKVQILKKIGINDQPRSAKPVSKQLGKLIRYSLGNTTGNDNNSKGEVFAEIQEIVSHSELPENMTNTNVIQFRVVRDNQGRQLEVTSANLIVKIRYKRKKSRITGKRQKLKLKKIQLKLSTVSSDGTPLDVISTVSTRIRRTKWLKIPLPAEVIENAIQRKEEHLMFHLQCEGCRKGVQLILINGRKKDKKKKKRRRKTKIGKVGLRELDTKRIRRKRRLNRTRPFLILYTKVNTYIRLKREIRTLL